MVTIRVRVTFLVLAMPIDLRPRLVIMLIEATSTWATVPDLRVQDEG